MFDFIKRAQLTRKGLSCGKTRRKHLQGEFWETLRCNPMVGLGLFVSAFIGITVLMKILGANLPGATGASFIFTAAVFLPAAVHWYLSLPADVRPNGHVLLVFCAVVLHLAAVGVVLSYGHHRGWPPSYTLLLVPHALGPVILCMLAGRRISLFGAVYATLLAPASCRLTPFSRILRPASASDLSAFMSPSASAAGAACSPAVCTLVLRPRFSWFFSARPAWR
ncbi:hypothetical protein [Verrucomicrobium spinosum]|uniref:hypothetical protein n=1 Tax=Verrucomicrobium spinosum TaxID=2736 RepID=UPI00210912A2|nr:hypothetical protein [Verrucomicrobium spinosum]